MRRLAIWFSRTGRLAVEMPTKLMSTIAAVVAAKMRVVTKRLVSRNSTVPETVAVLRVRGWLLRRSFVRKESIAG